MFNFDIDYYDRQIRAININNFDKIRNSSILIDGLEKGLGTEICKHLVLNGINIIHLFDSNLVIETDLENGYYYNKLDINKKRSEILKSKFENKNVDVNIFSVDNFYQNQDISILINKDINYIKKCEKYNTKIIVLFSYGFAGCIFINANLNKYYNNIYKNRIIDITSDGIVYCNNNNNFSSDDIIIFNNLEGINLEYFNKEWKIHIINNTTFKLQDYDNNQKFTFINGFTSNILNTVIINDKYFSESLENNSELINTFINKSNNHLNFKLLNYEFITTISIMGSFVALKTIQIITNTYISNNQWFEWSDDNLINKINIIENELEINKSFTNIGKVFGKNIEDKLINLKISIIGCGSISSEHLKNLSFLNIGNNKLGNGEINIYDSKLIHKSNLNSNFLFENNNINKFKCDISKNKIISMKPDININVFNTNLTTNNNLINKNIDCVLSSVDNIEIKQIINDLCFKFDIPYIDSGVNGYFGHTQSIIPYKTELYTDFIDFDYNKSYLSCVIENFPNCNNHTIEWAIEKLKNLKNNIINYNKYLKNKNYIDCLDEKDKSIFLDNINTFSKIITIKDCINYGIEIFNNNYYHNIIKLLNNFPNNHITSDNKLFWANGKLCPKPILFDIHNILHLEFIKATINIILENNDIKKYNININDIKNNTYDNININYNQLNIDDTINIDYTNDNNIYWILNASNIRSLNYDINISTFYETKGIVGNIISKISMISSIVSGLSILEIIKYILICDLDNYRNNYINQCNCNIIYTYPKINKYININGNKINKWLKFEYNKNTSLLEFKIYYENIFKTNIIMIIFNTSLIYSDILNIDNINKNIKDIINEYNLDNNINISLLSDGDDDLPIILLNI